MRSPHPKRGHRLIPGHCPLDSLAVMAIGGANGVLRDIARDRGQVPLCDHAG